MVKVLGSVCAHPPCILFCSNNCGDQIKKEVQENSTAFIVWWKVCVRLQLKCDGTWKGETGDWSE